MVLLRWTQSDFGPRLVPITYIFSDQANRETFFLCRHLAIFDRLHGRRMVIYASISRALLLQILSVDCKPRCTSKASAALALAGAYDIKIFSENRRGSSRDAQ